MGLSKFVKCALASVVLALSACVCMNAQSWQEVVYTFGGDYNGFYFSPQVGCHFCFGHSLCGPSVGIGYEGTLTGESEYFGGYEWSENYVIGGVEFSVIFDF